MSIRKYKDWRNWWDGLCSISIKAGAEALATNFSALLGTNGVAHLGIPGLQDIGLNWKTAIATCLTQFALRTGVAAFKYIAEKDPEIVTVECDSNPQAFTRTDQPTQPPTT